MSTNDEVVGCERFEQLIDPNSTVPTNRFQVAANKRWNRQKSSNGYNTDAATLKRQQNRYDAKQNELEERKKSLDTKENTLVEREKALNEREETLVEREKSLNEREETLVEREKALNEREETLVDREIEFSTGKMIAPPMNTPKRKFRGPSKRLKPYDELRRTQKRKRQTEATRLGVPLPPDPTDAINVIAECSIPRETQRKLNAISPKLFPSEYSYEKEKRKILNSVDWKNAPTVGNKNDKVLSFAQSLIWRVSNIGTNILPQVPQVTVGLDSGDRIDKIGFFLNNLFKPQRDSNFFLLAVSHDPEKYEYIKALFIEIFRDISLLNDFSINGEFIIFEFFFVADLKGICTCFGHQGPSATYFCPFCYATKKPIVGPVNMRTLDELLELGKKAEKMKELHGEKSKRFKDFCKDENFSISRMPLIDFIPLTHVVPPPLHVKIGAVNYTLKEAIKHDKEAVIKLLEDCNIEIQFPSHNLTGGDASKMLRLIAEGKVRYDGFGSKLFELLYEIDEEFMECRDYDDDELEIFDEIIQAIRVVIHENYPVLYSSQHLHDLVDHVPSFFRLHRSWGRYGEHSLERSHQNVKNEAKHLKSGNKEEYAHKQCILKTACFDRNIQS